MLLLKHGLLVVGAMIGGVLATGFAAAAFHMVAAIKGVVIETDRLGNTRARQAEKQTYGRLCAIAVAIASAGSVGIHSVLASAMPGNYLAHLPCILLEVWGYTESYIEFGHELRSPFDILARVRQGINFGHPRPAPSQS